MSATVEQAKERIRKFLKQWEAAGRRSCIAGAPDDAARSFVELMVEDLRAVVSAPELVDADEPTLIHGVAIDFEGRLRDEFAMRALQGLLSNEGAVSGKHESGQEIAAADCKRAYLYADAMLRAREVQA